MVRRHSDGYTESLTIPAIHTEHRMHCPMLLLAAVLPLLACSTTCAWQLVTEEDPPYNMRQNGRVVGISTDKLLEAFQRAGVQPDINIMPWVRAHQSALTHSNHCVFSTARNEVDFWASTQARASRLLAADNLTSLIVPALSFGRSQLYLLSSFRFGRHGTPAQAIRNTGRIRYRAREVRQCSQCFQYG